MNTVWHGILAGVYFWGLAIQFAFCVTNICNKDRLVFLIGNEFFFFCNFHKVPSILH